MNVTIKVEKNSAEILCYDIIVATMIYSILGFILVYNDNVLEKKFSTLFLFSVILGVYQLYSVYKLYALLNFVINYQILYKFCYMETGVLFSLFLYLLTYKIALVFKLNYGVLCYGIVAVLQISKNVITYRSDKSYEFYYE